MNKTNIKVITHTASYITSIYYFDGITTNDIIEQLTCQKIYNVISWIEIA